MKKIPLFFLVLGLARCACAQQPPLPPGPLLTPVADNTRWTLTTTSKAAEPDKPSKKSQPKAGKKQKANTVIGERMGKMAHTTSVLTNGTKEEEWTDGNLTAILEPGAQDPSFTTGTVDEVPMPSWVSRKNFVEVKTEGKRATLFFVIGSFRKARKSSRIVKTPVKTTPKNPRSRPRRLLMPRPVCRWK